MNTSRRHKNIACLTTHTYNVYADIIYRGELTYCANHVWLLIASSLLIQTFIQLILWTQ